MTISIDEIDLSGVDPARRFQVVATFETELSRLVRSGGLERLEAGALDMGQAAGTRLDLAIDVSPQHNPVHLGLALARSVYGALL